MSTSTPWVELCRSIEVEEVLPPIGPKKTPMIVVPKPDPAWLDGFEARTGFQLPHGYREFITLFGPGELGGDFQIRALGYHLSGNGQDAIVFNKLVDLEDFNLHLRQHQLCREFAEPEQVVRLVYFADDTAGDLYGWDPRDMRTQSLPEYGVYVVEREEKKCVRFVASSFLDFTINRVLGSVEDYHPPKTFRLASFRPNSRHKPEALWLSREGVVRADTG